MICFIDDQKLYLRLESSDDDDDKNRSEDIKNPSTLEEKTSHHTPIDQTTGDPCLSIEGFINHGIEINESQDLDLNLSRDLHPSSKRSSLAWSESGGSRLGTEEGNASTVDLSTLLAGPGDSSSGIWDADSTHTEKSETGSIGLAHGARSRPEGNRSGVAAKDGSHEGKGVRAMKKRKRNRHVNIEDIVIEFDPQKEYMWEMWLKYEQEKGKKAKTGKSAAKLDDSVPKCSPISLSVDKQVKADVSSGADQVTKETELWSPVEQSSPESDLQSKNSVHRRRSPSTGVVSMDQKMMEFSAEEKTHSGSVPEQAALIANADRKMVADPEDEQWGEDPETEMLVIHRLPGEKLGMGLRIESNGDESDPVQGVFVQSITPGGAADKATGGSSGICVGDEILKINGMTMKDMPYSEALAFFRTLPLRMLLQIRRARVACPVEVKRLPSEAAGDDDISIRQLEQVDVPEGFQLIEVSFEKEQTESLGLSIMPSYGSTREYHQVKRVSPTSVSAREGRLRQGDRFVVYNDRPMSGLSQNQCLEILNQPATHCQFKLLRTVSTERASETRASVMFLRHDAVQLQSRGDDADSMDSENVLSAITVEDHSDYSLNHNQLFAKNQLRLPCSKPSSPSVDDMDLANTSSEESGSESADHVGSYSFHTSHRDAVPSAAPDVDRCDDQWDPQLLSIRQVSSRSPADDTSNVVSTCQVSSTITVVSTAQSLSSAEGTNSTHSSSKASYEVSDLPVTNIDDLLDADVCTSDQQKSNVDGVLIDNTGFKIKTLTDEGLPELAKIKGYQNADVVASSADLNRAVANQSERQHLVTASKDFGLKEDSRVIGKDCHYCEQNSVEPDLPPVPCSSAVGTPLDGSTVSNSLGTLTIGRGSKDSEDTSVPGGLDSELPSFPGTGPPPLPAVGPPPLPATGPPPLPATEPPPLADTDLFDVPIVQPPPPLDYNSLGDLSSVDNADGEQTTSPALTQQATSDRNSCTKVTTVRSQAHVTGNRARSPSLAEHSGSESTVSVQASTATESSDRVPPSTGLTSTEGSAVSAECVLPTLSSTSVPSLTVMTTAQPTLSTRLLPFTTSSSQKQASGKTSPQTEVGTFHNKTELRAVHDELLDKVRAKEREEVNSMFSSKHKQQNPPTSVRRMGEIFEKGLQSMSVFDNETKTKTVENPPHSDVEKEAKLTPAGKTLNSAEVVYSKMSERKVTLTPIRSVSPLSPTLMLSSPRPYTKPSPTPSLVTLPQAATYKKPSGYYSTLNPKLSSSARASSSPNLSVGDGETNSSEVSVVKPNSLSTRPLIYRSQMGRSSSPTSLSTSRLTDVGMIKKCRTAESPFQVEVLKGMLGLGITTVVRDNGVQITDILESGPVGRNGNIRVGDYLLSVNGRQLHGLSQDQVNNSLKLLPSSLISLVVSVAPPSASDQNRQHIADTVSVVTRDNNGPVIDAQIPYRKVADSSLNNEVIGVENAERKVDEALPCSPTKNSLQESTNNSQQLALDQISTECDISPDVIAGTTEQQHCATSTEQTCVALDSTARAGDGHTNKSSTNVDLFHRDSKPEKIGTVQITGVQENTTRCTRNGEHQQDNNVRVSHVDNSCEFVLASQTEKAESLSAVPGAEGSSEQPPAVSSHVTGLANSEQITAKKIVSDSAISETDEKSTINKPLFQHKQGDSRQVDSQPAALEPSPETTSSELSGDVRTTTKQDIPRQSEERDPLERTSPESSLSSEFSGQNTETSQSVCEGDVQSLEPHETKLHGSSSSETVSEVSTLTSFSAAPKHQQPLPTLTPRIKVEGSCDKSGQAEDSQFSNYLNELDMEYFKPTSVSLRATSDGSDISSRRSSISEGGSSEGGRRAPPLPAAPRRASLVDEIHMKRQEALSSSKLHGLQLPSRPQSTSSSSSSSAVAAAGGGPNLPVIAKTPTLPTLKLAERRTSYQPLLPRPFRSTASFTSAGGTQSRRFSATFPVKAADGLMNSFQDENKENVSSEQDNQLGFGVKKKWMSGSLSNLNSDDIRWKPTDSTRTAAGMSSTSNEIKAYTPTPFSKTSVVMSASRNGSSAPHAANIDDDVISTKSTSDISTSCHATTSHDIAKSPDKQASGETPPLPETAPPDDAVTNQLGSVNIVTSQLGSVIPVTSQLGSIQGSVNTITSQSGSVPGSVNVVASQLGSITGSVNTIKHSFREINTNNSGRMLNEDCTREPKTVTTGFRFTNNPELSDTMLADSAEDNPDSQSSVLCQAEKSSNTEMTSSNLEEQADHLNNVYSERSSTIQISEDSRKLEPMRSLACDKVQGSGDQLASVSSEHSALCFQSKENIRDEQNCDGSPMLPSSSPPDLPTATGDLIGLDDDADDDNVSSAPAPSMPTARQPETLNTSGSFDSLLDLPHKSYTNSHTDSGDELDAISQNISPRRPELKSSVMSHSRDDLSEHGMCYESPVAPLSPTPSDADSGIYSTKTDHKSDLESLASKDTSPSGTWKSDRFSSLLKSDKVPKSPRSSDGASEYHTAVQSEQTEAEKGIMEVEFEKGNLGLGFCIEGGKGSPLGDRPIIVKRLFRGETPVQNVLKPGDEIIAVNGTDISSMSKFSAWNYLKSLPLGTVKLQIRRK